MLFEPKIITKYNEEEDNLLIAIYFKNPPGRILRNKWNAAWKVLPSVENWMKYFKNNEKNKNNAFYYNIDD